MKRLKFTDSQIMDALKRAEAGPVWRHGHNNGLSPAQLEKRFSVRQIRV